MVYWNCGRERRRCGHLGKRGGMGGGDEVG